MIRLFFFFLRIFNISHENLSVIDYLQNNNKQQIAEHCNLYKNEKKDTFQCQIVCWRLFLLLAQQHNMAKSKCGISLSQICSYIC